MTARHDDLFMATVGSEAGFELGDFASKTEGKRYRIWHVSDGGGSIDGSPLIKNDMIFIGAGDHYFYAIDKNTGKQIWRFRASGLFCDSCATIWKDRLFINCYDHNLYALNWKTGEEVWRFRTGDKIASKPAVDDGVIYFGSTDCNFYAVTKEGKLLWKFRTENELWSTPIVNEGVVYFGAYDCHLYAVDAKTGKERFRFKTSSSKVSEYTIEQETVFEFKAPKVEEMINEESDRYEVKSEIIHGGDYKTKSEYQMEIHYSSGGKEYK